MVEVRKKQKEANSVLLSRFSFKLKKSGVLREAKKRRYYKRIVNRRQKRLSAIYRQAQQKETEQAKKMGVYEQHRSR